MQVFYQSLQPNECELFAIFRPWEFFCWTWREEGGWSLGLFYCLILSTLETLAVECNEGTVQKIVDCISDWIFVNLLKGLSYEIDFENVDENGQTLA